MIEIPANRFCDRERNYCLQIKRSQSLQIFNPAKRKLMENNNIKIQPNTFPKDNTFDNFENRIESKLKEILNLEDNWDGENSKSISEITAERTKKFLMELKKNLVKKYTQIPETPLILPGPNRSIDVHWRKKSYDLLVNLPMEPTAHITLAGDINNKSVIKLSITEDEEIEVLASWLNIAIQT
ncbi:MAG: hypothetical protein GF311_26715 [Candidatus Lokiarchaeota archaeon]|nr:hypothetical protein [Candidatus Lokiarchaeota archaeon]